MTSRAPVTDAIGFAERVVALLDEGSFTATYKYAVLLGLLDVVLERTSATTFFFADAAGGAAVRRHLHLEPAARGENVVIEEPQEDDVFLARIEPAPGIWCSGAVQTWLDLSASGERGREAAAHLLSERLLPAWRSPHRSAR